MYVFNKGIKLMHPNFFQIYSSTFNKCCPLSKVKKKVNYEKSPWITSGILKSIRHKNKLYYKFIQNPTSVRKLAYTRFKNRLTTTINLAKKLHFSNLIEDHKGDSTQLWKVINKLLHKKRGDDSNKTFECANGSSSTDDNDIVNNFNSYFSSVASDLAKTLRPGQHTPLSYINSNIPNTFVFFPTNIEEVKLAISKLKNGKSPGYDNITNDILKHVADIISIPLTHIINLSFSSGVFPSEMKIAKVIPIFKSGDPKLFSNYRPISVLPAISKIIERLAYDRLNKFITKHKILYTNQYGFRSNHSTYMAALSLIDNISRGLDNRLTTAAIFIDLSKAFDTIDHHILLNKLLAYGVRGTAHNWFCSYLHNRCNYVQFKNSTSDRVSCNIGVPQGSILGPLLFILYINDIHKSSMNSNFILFADDTTVFLQKKNLHDTLAEASSEFSHISDWLRTNKLSLNILKTKLLIFDNKVKDFRNINVILDGHQVNASSHAKFLGLTIDDRLNWKQHISEVSKQLSKSNGVINRLKNVLPKKSLLTLYNALVLPHLNYSLLVWGNTQTTLLNSLFKLQKRVLRNINQTHYISHTAPLFIGSNILTLYDLYKYQLGIFMYKFHYGLLPPAFNNFYTYNSNYHTYDTRSKNMLHHTYSRTSLNLSQIRSTGVLFWNSLNHDIKFSPTLNTFKRKLKQYLMHNISTY